MNRINENTFQNFLRAYFGTPGEDSTERYLCVVSMTQAPDGGKSYLDEHEYFNWGKRASAALVHSWANRRSREGKSLFFCPALRSEKSIVLGTAHPDYLDHLWVDLDYPAEIDELPTQGRAFVVASGRPGHKHVYVPLTGPVAFEEHRRLNAAFARSLQGDAKWADNSLLRLPGSVNTGRGHNAPVELLQPEGEDLFIGFNPWTTAELTEQVLTAESLSSTNTGKAVAPGTLPEWHRVKCGPETKGYQSLGAKLKLDLKKADADDGTRRYMRCHKIVMDLLEAGRSRNFIHSILDDFAPGVNKWGKARWHQEIDRSWMKGLSTIPAEKPDKWHITGLPEDGSARIKKGPAPKASTEEIFEIIEDPFWVDWDVIFAGDYSPLEPDAFERSDGIRLFYSKRINYLYGDGGAGKTFIALILVAEVLKAGGKVALFDMENEPTEIVARLIALGVAEEVIKTRVFFRSSDAPYLESDAEESWNTHLNQPFDWIIIDSTGQHLALEGMDENKNVEVKKWNQAFLARLISQTGAGILCLDHQIKADGRKDGVLPADPVGAGQKIRDVTGAAYIARVISGQRFGRGTEGRVRLILRKDRPGFLYQHSVQPTNGTSWYTAEIILDATDEENYKISINPCDDTGNEVMTPEEITEVIKNFFRLNPKEQYTTSAILAQPDGRGGRLITPQTKETKEHVAIIMKDLHASGFLLTGKNGRNYKINPLELPSEAQLASMNGHADNNGARILDFSHCRG